MAFTKTPMAATDETKPLLLMTEWTTRDITNAKDVDNVNCLFEPVQQQLTGEQYFHVLKRDGSVNFTTTDAPSEVFRSYYWQTIDKYIEIGAFGARSYVASNGNLSTISTDPLCTFNDTYIGVTEFLFQDGTSKLVVTDGSSVGLLDGSMGWTPITDPDRPIIHRPYPVFLDGYLFLADLKGNICNSDLNAPTSWVASNFLAVESYPDPVRAISRLGQYIVAFGDETIQFFYDAANPTGTPLAMQTTVLRVGFQGGLVQYGDTLLFIGHQYNSKASVYQLTGFKATPVGDFSMTRRLQEYNSQGSWFRYGNVVNFNGHDCYTWVDRQYSPAQPYDSIYALDLSTRMWTRLAYQGTSTFQIRTCALVDGQFRTRSIFTLFGGVKAFEIIPSVYQDAGVNFTVKFQTANQNFGTSRVKFGSRLQVEADQTPAASSLMVSWSNDDFQTWTTPRAIDLSQQYQQLWALGQFRKRAWRFTYTDNYPMRWTQGELDYQQGQA